MSQPTPGARVRIMVEGTVQTAQPGEIQLASGTHITSHTPDVTVEILKPGFQAGDVVHNGDTHLMRVSPEGQPAYWIGSDGRQIQDDEHDPTRLNLVTRPTMPTTTELQTGA